MSARPRVGISRCLLGDEVRYDGTHRRHDLVDALGPHVEWVPVCPEVEVGMGTPREPIVLVAGAGGVRSAGLDVRLMGVHSGEDWTTRMAGWARARVRALDALELSGYVLKARSPSCALTDAPVEGSGRFARGLFAEALVEAMPELPVADEEELADPQRREWFLARVMAHRS